MKTTLKMFEKYLDEAIKTLPIEIQKTKSNWINHFLKTNHEQIYNNPLDIKEYLFDYHGLNNSKQI